MSPVKHSKPRVLILGGTTEANKLAELLETDGRFAVTTSRAGVTSDPKAVAGESRSGGFGGVEGLRDYLQREGFAALIDATHPFAAGISRHAAEACDALGLPRLLLSRPAWQRQEGDRWITAQDLPEAVDKIADLPVDQRVFLTTGQKELPAFASLKQHHFLARMIEPPKLSKQPDNLEILLARGPFSEADERALLERHGITLLVSKNAGGEATTAKLSAARALGLPVLMIERPPLPDGPKASSPEEALDWLRQAFPAD